MDLSWRTREEVEALLRLLTETLAVLLKRKQRSEGRRILS
jgi:hypothetical protein